MAKSSGNASGLFLVVALAAGLSVTYFSCSQNKDAADDKTADDDPAKAGTVELSTNELAVAYPEGLNVTTFPEEKVDATMAGEVAIETGLTATDALTLQASGGAALQEDATGCLRVVNGVVENSEDIPNFPGAIDPTNPCEGATAPTAPTEEEFQPFKRPPQTKLQEAHARLEGTAERCFSPEIMRALAYKAVETERCYQFDYGIMRGASCASEEACMVSYSRGVVADSVAHVESALDLVQAMLCQAKKEGMAEKPGVGESKDLLELLGRSASVDTERPSFTKARITRLPDVDGRPVYKTEIALELNERTREITMAHSPSAAGTNDTYNGILWIKWPTPLLQAVGDDKDTLNAVSVKYARSGEGADSRVKMEVRFARMKDDRVPFTTTGEVNFNAGANFTGDPADLPTYGRYGDGQANQYVKMMSFYAFDINPTTTEGSLAFWKNPGGEYYEPARGFVFNVELNKDSGLLEGCAIAGSASADEMISTAGISIRRSIREEEQTLVPRGYFTPFVCDENGSKSGTTVWKQCFTQTEAGIYVVDETKTTAAQGQGFERLEAAAADVAAPDIAAIPSVGEVNAAALK